jgi:hypothetical protein
MVADHPSSATPRPEGTRDVLDVLAGSIARTAAREAKPEPPHPGSSDPGRTQPRTPDRENASRSLGEFSRAPLAVAHRRRWTAVLEDRGEGSVPAQGH